MICSINFFTLLYSLLLLMMMTMTMTVAVEMVIQRMNNILFSY